MHLDGKFLTWHVIRALGPIVQAGPRVKCKLQPSKAAGPVSQEGNEISYGCKNQWMMGL